MPDADDQSIFDIGADAAFEARLDAEAMADCRAGRVIAHETMREWLLKLASGERAPLPEV